MARRSQDDAMECAACGHANPVRALFCESCGAGLAVCCAGCGTALRSGARFCDACGARVAPPGPGQTDSPRAYTPRHLAEKILTNRAALEGERKQVTVLFADVKGSMDLAAQVDAETWHRIMDGFFAILAEGVHRFEGTINQYTGDGIMALFGAPVAHEDHAQRAGYAALRLRDELRRYAQELRRTQGLDFAVRIGLNSGEVIVGKIGDDLRMDYTAQGHTVGLAARMEQIAEAGTVYLTAHTAALVGGYFQLDDLGDFAIKGVREPLRVYQLRDVGALRTRFDVSRARGFSRFVGRDAEMAALDAAFARVGDGHGQVVGIVAEAGVGKSRLCFEFAEHCRARGIEVNGAAGVPHGKWVPFLPLLELLRGFCGVSERDAPGEARRKIVGTLLLRDEGFKDDLPLLFDFLGVPDPARPLLRMDPDARQRQLFGVVRRLIQTRTRGLPAVMLFEDLHWIDGASETALANLIEIVPATPTLLVLNFRPEYRAAWMQKPYYQQITLTPLGDVAVAALLHDLLGNDASLVTLGEHIKTRTAGNPFFIEEVVRSLFDHGVLVRTGSNGSTCTRLTQPVTEIEIPPTVQSVLAARIDRLNERDKAVLQIAAVIGKEFAERVLQRVIAMQQAVPISPAELADALRTLTAAELIDERALHPEVEYAFRHPLTHEVAYRSQLTEQRARVHDAAARTIIELDADKLDERAALLAHHFEGAGAVLEAAQWMRRAAEWVASSDVAEAHRRWRELRALLETAAETPETRELLTVACMHILNLGVRMGITPEEAAAVFAHGKALAERSGDRPALARLLANYGMVRGSGGDIAAATTHIMEATRLAHESADVGLQVGLLLTTVIWQLHGGELRSALAVVERVLELTRDDHTLGMAIVGFNPHVFAILYRGVIRLAAGELRAASRDLDRAIELAQARGDLEVVAMARGFYALVGWFTGDATLGLTHARQAVEIAERIGSPLARGQAYGFLGIAHVQREEWDAAVSSLQQELAIARAHRTLLFVEAGTLAMLAQAYLGRGDHALARATAEQAVAVARQRGSPLFECDGHMALAQVLLGMEGVGARVAVESALAETERLVEATGARSRAPFVHLRRAELARQSGDPAWRERELRRAQQLFTEIGASGHAAATARMLHEVSPQGQRRDSESALR
jgi:class 3 adenylate cyclase/tetratricopeptide (TPR) repeat protein